MLSRLWKRYLRWRVIRKWAGFERCTVYPHIRNKVWTPKMLAEKADYFAAHPSKVEYITGSALRDTRDGIVYVSMRPGRHFHVIRWMAERDYNRHRGKINSVCEQGFFTNKFRYIGREEARALAIANGQVREQDLTHSREIFSEDLWETPEKYQYKGDQNGQP